MAEGTGMSRPSNEEALVWVHWHCEGLNMCINLLKGGPAGVVGLRHMVDTQKMGGRRTHSGRRQTGRCGAGHARERHHGVIGGDAFTTAVGIAGGTAETTGRSGRGADSRATTTNVRRGRACPRHGTCRCPSPTKWEDLGSGCLPAATCLAAPLLFTHMTYMAVHTCH
jgi:hypothetical protein